MIGSLTVTELPTRDAQGRRVAVQRYKGTGPSRAGDVYAVMVDVPREIAGGRRMVDVVTAGTIECVTPSRGAKRGTWTLQSSTEDTEPQTVEHLTRDGAALLLAAEVAAPAAEPAPVVADADVVRIDPADRPTPLVASLAVAAGRAYLAEADALARMVALEEQLQTARLEVLRTAQVARDAWNAQQGAMFDL